MRMENPLQGSFNRERTVLVFQQRSREVYAALWALIIGSGMFFTGLFRLLSFRTAAAWWFLIVGGAVAAAALWAYLLFRFIKFDLRKRTYVERFGSGLLVQWRRGSLDEVNCLGLESYQGFLPELRQRVAGWTIAGPSAAYAPGQVFVVRLWWKDKNRYPPVIEHLFASHGSVAEGMMFRS